MTKSPEILEISRVLVFANWTQVPSAEAAYKLFEPTAKLAIALFVEDKRSGSLVEVGGVRSEIWNGERLTAERELELLEQWRRSAHAMLSQIVGRKMKQARREFGEKFTRELDRGVIVGQARFDGRVLVQNSRFDGPLIAHVAFVLALLLDAQHPFGRMLKRCRWRPCKRFFLHDKRGKSPSYCPACREPGSAQYLSSAAERQRIYRRSLKRPAQ